MPVLKTAEAPAFSKTFLYPNYWPTWFFIGFMRLSILLPFRWQIALGCALGWLLYYLLPKRKKIARTNLRLCFPKHSETDIDNLTKEHFKNVGASIFETAMAWWASNKRLENLHIAKGLNNLSQYVDSDKPLLILSAHFCGTDLGARLLSLHTRFQAMYKPAKNKLYDYIMYHSRARAYTVVDNSNVKQFIRNKKKGYISWYAPDQNLHREEHLFVNFFNVPTLCITAPSRLAKITQAKAIGYFPIRKKYRYEIVFTPTLENFPSDDMHADLLTINAAIETGICLAPSQYLWTHKRFHKLPDGTDRQYT